MQANPLALELSLPDTHPDVQELAEGTPLLVQYQLSKTEPGRATVHRMPQRPDGTPIDVAPERIGVIDHMNHERSLLHVVIARDIDGTCPISAYHGTAKVGIPVAVRLARHEGRGGPRTRIVSISPADQVPAQDVFCTFREVTNVKDGGLGFTSSGIFISPELVAAAGIVAGDLVEGSAILSYDKRRASWGLKAIDARSVAKGRPHFGGGRRVYVSKDQV